MVRRVEVGSLAGPRAGRSPSTYHHHGEDDGEILALTSAVAAGGVRPGVDDCSNAMVHDWD